MVKYIIVLITLNTFFSRLFNTFTFSKYLKVPIIAPDSTILLKSLTMTFSNRWNNWCLYECFLARTPCSEESRGLKWVWSRAVSDPPHVGGCAAWGVSRVLLYFCNQDLPSCPYRSVKALFIALAVNSCSPLDDCTCPNNGPSDENLGSSASVLWDILGYGAVDTAVRRYSLLRTFCEFGTPQAVDVVSRHDSKNRCGVNCRGSLYRSLV